MTDIFNSEFSKDFERGFEEIFGKTPHGFFNSFETRLEDARYSHKVTRRLEDGVVTLITDLPGVKKEDLEVSFEELADNNGTRLLIAGVRDGRDVKVTARLNDRVKQDEANATLENGVLTITVPLEEDSVPKVTKVKIS